MNRKYKIGDKVVVLDYDRNGSVTWYGVVVDYYPDGDYKVEDMSDGTIGSCDEDILRPYTKLHRALQ